MGLPPDQRSAVTPPEHLAVSAGAGSGTTRVLVERYLRLVDAVAAPAAPGDDPWEGGPPEGPQGDRHIFRHDQQKSRPGGTALLRYAPTGIGAACLRTALYRSTMGRKSLLLPMRTLPTASAIAPSILRTRSV